MTYNTTGLESSNTIVDVFLYSNTLTNGLFLSGLLFVIYIIMIYTLQLRDDFLNAVIVSSWVCFVLSGFLLYLDAINSTIVLMFLIVTGITTFYKMFSS